MLRTLTSHITTLPTQMRRQAISMAIEAGFTGFAAVLRNTPMANPKRYNIRVERNIPYQDSQRREHLLDIFQPQDRSGPLPVVLYVHGGGFHLLSKETHWVMALNFARQGYLVVNINYRLAPRNPFPHGMADVCAAYVWLHQNIEQYGGDKTRVVLAGESAGANLVTSLAIAACYERPEPFAREVWQLNRVPQAVLPACGLLQVSDPERFRRRKTKLSPFISTRLVAISSGYLQTTAPNSPATDLADPLLLLESQQSPDRPLPPFFGIVGTRDPLLDDTRRLADAVAQHGGRCDVRYYPGGLHAFHALIWKPEAQAAWADTFTFLDGIFSQRL